jgi:hypothetical protein
VPEQESLKMLQSESQVALNTVESVEGFLTDVQSGNWYSNHARQQTEASGVNAHARTYVRMHPGS